jgi:hypothetical protein
MAAAVARFKVLAVAYGRQVAETLRAGLRLRVTVARRRGALKRTHDRDPPRRSRRRVHREAECSAGRSSAAKARPAIAHPAEKLEAAILGQLIRLYRDGTLIARPSSRPLAQGHRPHTAHRKARIAHKGGQPRRARDGALVPGIRDRRPGPSRFQEGATALDTRLQDPREQGHSLGQGRVRATDRMRMSCRQRVASRRRKPFDAWPKRCGSGAARMRTGSFVRRREPIAPGRLADGAHVFTVAAIDRAGNVDPGRFYPSQTAPRHLTCELAARSACRSAGGAGGAEAVDGDVASLPVGRRLPIVAVWVVRRS